MPDCSARQIPELNSTIGSCNYRDGHCEI